MKFTNAKESLPLNNDLCLCELECGNFELCTYESWGWESVAVNRYESEVVAWAKVLPSGFLQEQA